MQWMRRPLLVLFGSLLLLNGCSTVSLTPPDLREPGWLISVGQASWLADPDQPNISAEVLLASRDNGDSYALMSKPPLDIFHAQSHSGAWQLELPPTEKTHSGRGNPPKQFIWFQIPALVQRQQDLPDPWLVGKADDTWLISNPETGETIRLVLYE